MNTATFSTPACTYVFRKPEVKFLGILVNENGVYTLPTKVQAIRYFPPGEKIVKLQRFCGVVNFYRRFIPKRAEVAQLLIELIGSKKKNASINLSNLRVIDVLRPYCRRDVSPDGQLSLMADASSLAMGAALNDGHNGSFRPIAFFPRLSD